MKPVVCRVPHLSRWCCTRSLYFALCEPGTAIVIIFSSIDVDLCYYCSGTLTRTKINLFYSTSEMANPRLQCHVSQQTRLLVVLQAYSYVFPGATAGCERSALLPYPLGTSRVARGAVLPTVLSNISSSLTQGSRATGDLQVLPAPRPTARARRVCHHSAVHHRVRLSSPREEATHRRPRTFLFGPGRQADGLEDRTRLSPARLVAPTRPPDDVTALRGVVRILPALAAVGAPNVPPEGTFALIACRRSTRFRHGAAAGVEEVVILCRDWAVAVVADFDMRSTSDLAFGSAEEESMTLLVARIRPVCALLALLATAPSLDFLAPTALMPVLVAPSARRPLRRGRSARTAAALLTVLTDADAAARPGLAPPPSSDSTAAARPAVRPAEMTDWVLVGGDLLALSDAPPLGRLPLLSSTIWSRSVSWWSR